MKKKIALIIAFEDYQPTEYGTAKKILQEAGYEIMTISDQGNMATATDKSHATVDVLLNNAHAHDYLGIFFIGGSGALEHLDNPSSYKLLRQAAEQHIPFGAICISSRILAKAGVLKGKRATGWNGDNQLINIFNKYGVNYVPKDVVVDGAIVTAKDPHATQEFAEEIIGIVQDQKGWA